MLNGPSEQAAGGVLEMSTLVRRAGRYPFLDLFAGNGRDGQIGCSPAGLENPAAKECV
jgi:hypothetical protein